MRKKSCLGALVVCIALTPWKTQAQTLEHLFSDRRALYDEVVFEETFHKDRKPVVTSRTIGVAANESVVVRVFMRNGGTAPTAPVRDGRMVVNGQVVFGTTDFKIDANNLGAFVSKELSLIPGDNSVVIELKGTTPGSL